jgi:hypothetical protein
MVETDGGKSPIHGPVELEGCNSCKVGHLSGHGLLDGNTKTVAKAQQKPKPYKLEEAFARYGGVPTASDLDLRTERRKMGKVTRREEISQRGCMHP